MRNLKFPEIDKKIQQSVYGAWGGSNSNEPPPIDGGWLDNVNVGPSGGSSGGSGGYGSGGSWDFGDNGFYDNGGYWGDSGGSGGGSSEEYYDHKLPNLPAIVPQQLNTYGSCVSYALSFVSNYLGYQINPFVASQHIDKIAGLLPGTSFTQGVSPSQAEWAIEGYFDAHKINSIAEVNAAIDCNHAVIANYITENPSAVNNNTMTVHEVVIVEYNDWNYRIADSLSGQYSWVSKESITFNNGAYEIVGIRQ
ncbi:hypothetical protein ACHRVW_09005 [Flavobacterium collinsii]|uniref:hypothetical protein n=1 Tax=Flavobacterium collinsii TaxID=1114861 RepID=UPI003756FD69